MHPPNPDSIELSPFGGARFFSASGNNETLVRGGTAGGRFAANFSRHFSLEANYDFSVNNVRTAVPRIPGLFFTAFGNQIHSLSFNPVYNFTPRGSRVRPYLTLGIGPMWFVPTTKARAQLPVHENTEFAFNYGGGVKFHLSPHLGLRLEARGFFSQNPTFGLASILPSHLNGFQSTVGLVFFFGQTQLLAPSPPEPKPLPTLQPLNPGEIAGANGQLCQGRTFTLHATATDPAGRALAYVWKANGVPVGTNNPDLAFTPNNAGDFQFEVEVSDANDAARVIRVGPKTLVIQDYQAPAIQNLTASPNEITLTGDAAPNVSVKLIAEVAASACGGNLTYNWTVSEGDLINHAGPTALFDAASLHFEPGLGQSKSITASLRVVDESGQAASRDVPFTVHDTARLKRLPDVIFAKDSARFNACGKQTLLAQAAPQAGSAFDILLVGHRSSDERPTLDRQRLLAAGALLTAARGTCAHLDLSQIWFSAAGTGQISPFDPAVCPATAAAAPHPRDAAPADSNRRLEIYLVPKGSHTLPPAAASVTAAPAAAVKGLGCPQ